MAGLVPAIHVCKTRREDVDARHVEREAALRAFARA
jgi:hypothetical protein